MKLTIIINYILIIFIIHLILININYSKLIRFENNKLVFKDFTENYVPNFSIDETSPESVVVPSSSESNVTPSPSKSILTSSTECNISHKDKLLNFIKTEETAPSNYYSSDDNSSNFKSNVLDVDKFYKVNKEATQKMPEYDDLGINDSKYSNFDPSCANYSTSINDLRMGHHNR